MCPIVNGLVVFGRVGSNVPQSAMIVVSDLGCVRLLHLDWSSGIDTHFSGSAMCSHGLENSDWFHHLSGAFVLCARLSAYVRIDTNRSMTLSLFSNAKLVFVTQFLWLPGYLVQVVLDEKSPLIKARWSGFFFWLECNSFEIVGLHPMFQFRILFYGEENICFSFLFLVVIFLILIR